VHPLLDDPEEDDIVDDGVKPAERVCGLVVGDIQVYFEGVTRRKLLLEHPVAARKDHVM
jgi:hypothetical protein